MTMSFWHCTAFWTLGVNSDGKMNAVVSVFFFLNFIRSPKFIHQYILKVFIYLSSLLNVNSEKAFRNHWYFNSKDHKNTEANSPTAAAIFVSGVVTLWPSMWRHVVCKFSHSEGDVNFLWPFSSCFFFL